MVTGPGSVFSRVDDPGYAAKLLGAVVVGESDHRILRLNLTTSGRPDYQFFGFPVEYAVGSREDESSVDNRPTAKSFDQGPRYSLLGVFEAQYRHVVARIVFVLILAHFCIWHLKN